jgi:hypothetical protein
MWQDHQEIIMTVEDVITEAGTVGVVTIVDVIIVVMIEDQEKIKEISFL